MKPCGRDSRIWLRVPNVRIGMKCPSKSIGGEARVLAYVAGQLSGREELDMVSHVRECAGCAALVRSQSAVWDLLDACESPAVSADWNRRLQARIEQTPPDSLWIRFRRACQTWAARPAIPVAVLSLFFTVGLYLERPADTPGTPSAPIALPVSAPAVTPKDAEQLGKAFEDLQLLHQLDLVKDEAPDASHSM